MKPTKGGGMVRTRTMALAAKSQNKEAQGYKKPLQDIRRPDRIQKNHRN